MRVRTTGQAHMSPVTQVWRQHSFTHRSKHSARQACHHPGGRIRMTSSLLRCSVVCIPVVVMECAVAAVIAAVVIGGVPSTPGTVVGASSAATGAAVGSDAVETSPSEAAEIETRALCSRWASRNGIAMIGSMVPASKSGTMSIEVVADRSLTTSSRERLTFLEDTGESRERAGHPLLGLSLGHADVHRAGWHLSDTVQRQLQRREGQGCSGPSPHPGRCRRPPRVWLAPPAGLGLSPGPWGTVADVIGLGPLWWLGVDCCDSRGCGKGTALPGMGWMLWMAGGVLTSSRSLAGSSWLCGLCGQPGQWCLAGLGNHGFLQGIQCFCPQGITTPLLSTSVRPQAQPPKLCTLSMSMWWCKEQCFLIEAAPGTSWKQLHAMGSVEVDAEGFVCIWNVGTAAHAPLVKSPVRFLHRHCEGYWDVLDNWNGSTSSNLKDDCRTESLVKGVRHRGKSVWLEGWPASSCQNPVTLFCFICGPLLLGMFCHSFSRKGGNWLPTSLKLTCSQTPEMCWTHLHGPPTWSLFPRPLISVLARWHPGNWLI